MDGRRYGEKCARVETQVSRIFAEWDLNFLFVFSHCNLCFWEPLNFVSVSFWGTNLEALSKGPKDPSKRNKTLEKRSNTCE